MNSNINDKKTNLKNTKKIFFKKGPCSSALFYMLNREFGYQKESEERAAEPLAGGIMQTGNQCGMLWGATLAVGTESFKRYGKSDKAIAIAVKACQHLVESFSKRAKSVNCRDITKTNFKAKLGLLKYFITGKLFTCLNLSKKWVPEAMQSAKEGLNEEQNNNSQTVKSCTSELAKKMGASDEEIIIVAGLAGGIGLSGEGCGALGAAVWLKSLTWYRENDKSPYKNPYADKTLKAFMEETDYETKCHKICGQNFKTVEEHTNFIKNGGCDKLINILAQS